MSTQEVQRERPAEVVAGLISSASIFASLASVAYRPLRLVIAAILLALIASVIGGRHARLAGFAVAIGGICFVVGMAIAVLTRNPLW